MIDPSLDAGINAILRPNGDVYAADDHGFLLGQLLKEDSQIDDNDKDPPLYAQICLETLIQPTIDFMEEKCWPITIDPGQGPDPTRGRRNGIILTVRRKSSPT
jgi:hypothetical protein